MVLDTFAASGVHGSIVIQVFAGVTMALVTPISSSYWYSSFSVEHFRRSNEKFFECSPATKYSLLLELLPYGHCCAPAMRIQGRGMRSDLHFLLDYTYSFIAVNRSVTVSESLFFAINLWF